MELDAEAGESKIDRAIGRHSERRTPGEITREEIRPTTVSQVFQNEKVVPTWPECRCSTLKLRRRRRGRQNHNLIVDIQAIELRRFWARPQGMHIEIVSQATPWREPPQHLRARRHGNSAKSPTPRHSTAAEPLKLWGERFSPADDS